MVFRRKSRAPVNFLSQLVPVSYIHFTLELYACYLLDFVYELSSPSCLTVLFVIILFKLIMETKVLPSGK